MRKKFFLSCGISFLVGLTSCVESDTDVIPCGWEGDWEGRDEIVLKGDDQDGDGYNDNYCILVSPNTPLTHLKFYGLDSTGSRVKIKGDSTLCECSIYTLVEEGKTEIRKKLNEGEGPIGRIIIMGTTGGGQVPIGWLIVEKEVKALLTNFVQSIQVETIIEGEKFMAQPLDIQVEEYVLREDSTDMI